MNKFQLKPLVQSELNEQLAFRDGETKLGEKIYLTENESWKNCKFHILGVSEDIGPQLNRGRAGARYAYEAFISRFVNIQSTEFLSGEEICLHGVLEPLHFSGEFSEVTMAELDGAVADWVYRIRSLGGIPIIIGGGHNNAYPLIKGVSSQLNQAISVINMDPHADTRSLEGRHSGNSFSYAFEEKFLSDYSVLGLHENYNNQYILDYLKKIKAFTSFYESWLDKPFKFQADIDLVYDKHFHDQVGIELDMDAIAGMPSSAVTPSGITLDQARVYVRKMAGMENVCYLHLPEAAPQNEAEKALVGKALSYLVSDFIKVYLKEH